MKLLISFLLLFLISVSASSWAEDVPLRIVSLTPATTEILFALGLNDEIVGVSSFCNYPPEALKKEKVGTFSAANVEMILSLRPTIIFCTGLEQAPIVHELKQLGLALYICDPADWEQLFRAILDIGRLTDKTREAQILVDQIQTTLDEVKAKVDPVPTAKRPKVFFEIWHDPLMSAGQGSFIDALITSAGGINIAHDMQRPYSYLSPEQVLKNDPDIILLAYMTPEQPFSYLGSRLGWGKIAAVKNKRVYNDIDPNMLLRPGPRLADGLKELHKKLYPETKRKNT